MEGPDFLCVGMAKAGTGWLSDQVRHHPDFWMPPMEEMAYLGRKAPSLKRASRQFERLNEPARREKILAGQSPSVSVKEFLFMEELAACAGKPADLDRYASLYRHKGELKSGDISPGYSTLRESVIADISRRFPDIRVVLLLRDPISRIWSHLSMWKRNGDFDSSVLGDPAEFRSYLQSTPMIRNKSFPTQIVAHWQRAASTIKFRYFFFDDIVQRPDETRADVLAFLGADPQRKSGTLEAGYNRKSNSEKLELTKPIEAVLVEHYADELRESAAMFGGHAKAWATRYGL